MVFTEIWMSVACAMAGAITGSFLGFLVSRISRGESLLVPPRSLCPHCRHALGIRDLVPLMSFLLLRGRCRYCQTPIPVFYPTIELIAALITVALVSLPDPALSLWIWPLAMAGLAISIIDLRILIVPDRILLPLSLWAIGGNFFLKQIPPEEMVFGVLLGFWLPDLIGRLARRVLGRESLGFGDVKLGAVLGLYTGPSGFLLTLFLASLTGLAVGVFVRKDADQPGEPQVIPFAPFLVSAALMVILWGDILMPFIWSL